MKGRLMIEIDRLELLAQAAVMFFEKLARKGLEIPTPIIGEFGARLMQPTGRVDRGCNLARLGVKIDGIRQAAPPCLARAALELAQGGLVGQCFRHRAQRRRDEDIPLARAAEAPADTGEALAEHAP